MRVFIGQDPSPRIAAALAADGAELVNDLGSAEALVYTTEFPDSPDGSGLPALPDAVRWVQFCQAGVEPFAPRIAAEPERCWTNAAGAFGLQVAESALALLLSVLHMHPTTVRAGSWSAQPAMDAGTRWLDGARVLVLGAGGIGARLIPALRALGAEAIAVTRSGRKVPGARRSAAFADLDGLWAEADHLVVCCPLTEDTRGLVDAAALARLRPGAVVVNVARGPVVDTAALVDALDSGRLGGAGLDVTDPEPLPDGHPLWAMPNVLITPHTANTRASTDALLAPLVAENHRRLRTGREPLTGVRPGRGY